MTDVEISMDERAMLKKIDIPQIISILPFNEKFKITVLDNDCSSGIVYEIVPHYDERMYYEVNCFLFDEFIELKRSDTPLREPWLSFEVVDYETIPIITPSLFMGLTPSEFIDDDQEEAELSANAHFNIINRVLFFMNTHKGEIINKTQIEVDKNAHRNKEHCESNILKIGNSIYKYYGNSGKRSFDIKCESWSVRGHYRRYKSGKIVFVQPYKKGKKKDSVNPKDRIYQINGGNRNDS